MSIEGRYPAGHQNDSIQTDATIIKQTITSDIDEKIKSLKLHEHLNPHGEQLGTQIVSKNLISRIKDIFIVINTDRAIKKIADRLGISKQIVAETLKSTTNEDEFKSHLALIKMQEHFSRINLNSELRNSMLEINKVAPNFTEANLLATKRFVANNKKDLIEKMKRESKETVYIRPSEKNRLARAIQINQNGEVFIHFNKAQQKDIILGKGAFKKVKYAWNLNDNHLIAVARLDVTKQENKQTGINEAVVLNQFAAQPGFAQLSQLADVKGKGDKNKLLFLQPIYNKGDLFNASNSLNLDQKKSLAYQMVEACAKLGEQRIVHRDIKLDNFLVNERNGEYKVFLSDFGSSTSAKDKNITQKAGTSYCLSPEYRKAILDRNENAIRDATNEKLDAWALGATLFEMLTSEKLNYQDLSQNSFDEQCNQLDPELKPLIKSLLKVNPDFRLSAQEAFYIYKPLSKKEGP